MDGAILVVAGVDGPMPQTREHLLLANQVSSGDLLKLLTNVVIASCDDQDDETDFFDLLY